MPLAIKVRVNLKNENLEDYKVGQESIRQATGYLTTIREIGSDIAYNYFIQPEADINNLKALPRGMRWVEL